MGVEVTWEGVGGPGSMPDSPRLADIEARLAKLEATNAALAAHVGDFAALERRVKALEDRFGGRPPHSLEYHEKACPALRGEACECGGLAFAYAAHASPEARLRALEARVFGSQAVSEEPEEGEGDGG